jgi:hypothetical protein
VKQPLDAPYDGLAVLPRELWLPALVTSAGSDLRRIGDLPHWMAALQAGQLPDEALDFGDAQALAPLRRAAAELGLPALCEGLPPMVLQLLRSLLWHLDRIVDAQPRLDRTAAIAEVVAGFRADWTLERAGWEEVRALLQGLGDLAHLRWDALRGHLRSRGWQEALRISALLPALAPLAELIRRLGRSERSLSPPPRPQARPAPTEPQRQPTRWRETRLPDAPGELRGIRHTRRIEQQLGSEAAQLRHPVLHKLWRARLAEGRLLGYDSEAVLLDAVRDAIVVEVTPCPASG